MRILFLSNLYPPYEMGGYEQWCHEVANQLSKRGHELSIITSRHGVTSTSKREQSDVTRSLCLQTGIAYYNPLKFFIFRPYQELSNRKQLQKKINVFRPDVMMVWGMWNLSHNLPYWAEKWLPERITYFISSYWPIDPDPHITFWEQPTRKPSMELIKWPLRKLALSLLRYEGYPPQLSFSNAVCCSEYVRRTLVEHGKIPSDSGVLLGGIDPNPFIRNENIKTNKHSNLNNSLRLLYFGRLSRDKGVHTAIEAMGLLKQQGCHDLINLTIVGRGHPGYEAELRELVVQYDISEKVIFTGHVSREEIPAILGQFDVYLFTSIWPEPMARSVMEAMAAGLLVIGTEVGGQMEMLDHGQNALTFSPGDSLALAESISSIQKNVTLRMELSNAGKRMILKQFTLERMVDDIEHYLTKVVKKASMN